METESKGEETVEGGEKEGEVMATENNCQVLLGNFNKWLFGSEYEGRVGSAILAATTRLKLELLLLPWIAAAAAALKQYPLRIG